MGLFNESKEEERIQISTVDQLFDLAERLTACVTSYLNVSADKTGEVLEA